MKLVAVSGGIDSMVLLDKLLKDNNEIVLVAHVNYQKRKDSYLDAITIKEYLEDKDNVIFKERIISLDEYTNANFEAEARQMRYDFFVNLYHEYQVEGIYVAHHRDDFLETYLFKLERTGLYDYYGIKEKTYFQGCLIKRPLLNWYKEDIIEYAIEYNIPYCEDSTNLELNYTRNIIRAKLNKLTKLEKEQLYQEAQKLNTIIDQEKANILKLQDKIFFSVYEFELLSQNEKRRLLFNYFKKYDISIKHLDEIIRKIAESPSFKQRFLDTTIAKAYDTIYMLKRDYHHYECIINNEKDAIFFVNKIKNNYNYDIILETLDYPYLIRNYRMDDFSYLNINYQSYRNRIKKDKIPFFLRDIMPVIEKDNKVISFVKYQK